MQMNEVVWRVLAQLYRSIKTSFQLVVESKPKKRRLIRELNQEDRTAYRGRAFVDERVRVVQSEQGGGTGR